MAAVWGNQPDVDETAVDERQSAPWSAEPGGGALSFDDFSSYSDRVAGALSSVGIVEPAELLVADPDALLTGGVLTRGEVAGLRLDFARLGVGWEPRTPVEHSPGDTAGAEAASETPIEACALSPRTYVAEDGFGLGTWVVQQRLRWRNGTLPQRRVEAWEATPGWTWQSPQGAAARQTTLLDLLAAGRLEAGDVLVPTAPKYANARARLTGEGKIRVGEDVFDSPAEAARAITGKADGHGWTFWAVVRADWAVQSLAAVRDAHDRDRVT